jgi:hypothetical protein
VTVTVDLDWVSGTGPDYAGVTAAKGMYVAPQDLLYWQ